jgi:competence protein ComEA
LEEAVPARLVDPSRPPEQPPRPTDAAPAPGSPSVPSSGADGSGPDGADGTDVRPHPPADPAWLRLQDLLLDPETWRDRAGRRVAAVATVVRSGPRPGRSLAIGAVALGLGAAAFVALGAGGGAAPDPTQVLPRVAPAEPAPVASTPTTSIGPSEVTPAGPGTSTGSAPARIVVHAAGAVARPGVHDVAAGARVADLVAAAGGLTDDADPDRINLAAPLRDGERVYVPRRGEAVAPDVVAGAGDAPAGPAADGRGGGGGGGAEGGSGGAGPPARVDLNTADAAALEALPGIGPATAAAIIGHRAEHGPFASVDELQEVTGIGPAKLEQLRELVRV